MKHSFKLPAIAQPLHLLFHHLLRLVVTHHSMLREILVRRFQN